MAKKIIKEKHFPLQINDIIKIIRTCSGRLIEFRYGDLSIRLNPYLDFNPYQREETKKQTPETIQVEPQIPTVYDEPTHTQDQLDDELDLELVGMEDPSEYFRQLEMEERERAKANRKST